MDKPGAVLQRPVGSDAPFREHGDLPTAASLDAHPRKAKARAAKSKVGGTPTTDKKSERKAAAAFEKECARREKQRRMEEAAAVKERARRMAAREAAEAALEKETQEHEEKAAQIERDLEAVQRPTPPQTRSVSAGCSLKPAGKRGPQVYLAEAFQAYDIFHQVRQSILETTKTALSAVLACALEGIQPQPS